MSNNCVLKDMQLWYNVDISFKHNYLDEFIDERNIIEDNDLVSFYENQVCRFIKPLSFRSEELKDECNADEGED